LIEWLKKGLPQPLERLQTLLKKGLQATKTDWETLELVYGWVHQIAEIFDETQPLRCEERQLRFGLILLQMQAHAEQLGARVLSELRTQKSLPDRRNAHVFLIGL